MEPWLSKMEYKYGRYAIHGLPKIMAIGQAIMWIVIMLVEQRAYSWIALYRSALLHGQVWRLVTFLFTPYMTLNPLFLVIDLYFMYWVGSTLEAQWGSFRFNVYYLVGALGAVLGCLVTGSAGNEYILYSLFFAFAALYPEVKVLLFFFIPIKMKWLGVVSAVLYALNFIGAGTGGRIRMLLGLLNFALFFGPAYWQNYKAKKRRDEWKNNWR